MVDSKWKKRVLKQLEENFYDSKKCEIERLQNEIDNLKKKIESIETMEFKVKDEKGFETDLNNVVKCVEELELGDDEDEFEDIMSEMRYSEYISRT